MANLCNFKSYISNMNKAITQKKRILKYIPKNAKVILDYGCGSGMLTSLIAKRCPYSTVLGYDESSDMIKVAQTAYPKLKFTNDSFHLRPLTYDVIVISAVLHEVYSYMGGKKAVTDFYAKMYGMLKHGGKIIIRDGLADMPIDYFQIKMIGGFWDLIDKYNEEFEWGSIDTNIKKKEIFADKNNIKEFCNKVTWGKDSWAREIKERIYFYTFADYVNIGEYSKMEYEILTDHNYFKYLKEKFIIEEEWFTHIIIVYTKE
jgi:SAM-dependent methyltransferase